MFADRDGLVLLRDAVAAVVAELDEKRTALARNLTGQDHEESGSPSAA